MPADGNPLPDPTGLALVVGTAAQRERAVPLVGRAGYAAAEADDPYAAMAELCRRPDDYRVLVLSLQGLYREELAIVAAVKRVAEDLEVWLTDLDGRSAAMAEATRLGADALIGDDGLHRLVTVPVPTGLVARAVVEPLIARIAPPADVPVAALAAARLVLASAGHDGDGQRCSAPGTAARIERATGPAAVDGEPDDGQAQDQDAPDQVEDDPDDPFGYPRPDEPVLTADELRALLHDQPAPPTGGG